jgi:predicted lipoprotein
LTTCAHCSGPLVLRTAWEEVTGWAKPRKQGGQNSVFGRKRTGRLLCAECATKLTTGTLRVEDIGKGGAEQESML